MTTTTNNSPRAIQWFPRWCFCSSSLLLSISFHSCCFLRFVTRRYGMIPSNKCDAIATHNTNTSLAGLRTKTTATLSLFLFSFLLLVIFFPFLLFLPFFLILFFFLQGLAIPQNKNETKQPETKQDKTDKTNKQTPYTQDWETTHQ